MAIFKGGGKENKETSSTNNVPKTEQPAKTNTSDPQLIARPPDTKPGKSLTDDLKIEVTDNDEPAGPEEAFAKLLNSPEARKLMKGFAGAMSRGADQMIAAELETQKEKLGLTDDQTESIKGKLVAMIKEETERFKSELDDDSRSFSEIMEAQGDFWQNNEPDIDALFKEELSNEQYALYQREQLVEKTERVQRRATSELGQLNRTLKLSDEQADQVFGILVQQSSDYDESMAIEGITATLPEVANAEGVSKEDAIRSVLNPEQAETYNQKLESGGFSRRGGPWGRGRGFGRQ